MTRLPIVRHFRWLLWKWRIARYGYRWRLQGHDLSDVPFILDAIWRGRC